MALRKPAANLQYPSMADTQVVEVARLPFKSDVYKSEGETPPDRVMFANMIPYLVQQLSIAADAGGTRLTELLSLYATQKEVFMPDSCNRMSAFAALAKEAEYKPEETRIVFLKVTDYLQTLKIHQVEQMEGV